MRRRYVRCWVGSQKKAQRWSESYWRRTGIILGIRTTPNFTSTNRISTHAAWVFASYVSSYRRSDIISLCIKFIDRVASTTSIYYTIYSPSCTSATPHREKSGIGYWCIRQCRMRVRRSSWRTEGNYYRLPIPQYRTHALDDGLRL